MSASDWLTAWASAAGEISTAAVVGFTLVVAISGVRFAVDTFKRALR